MTQNKMRHENGYSDIVQDKNTMLFSELQNIQNIPDLIGIEPFSTIIKTVAGNIRPLTNFFIKKLNIRERIIENPDDTDWIWPQAYGRQVKKFLKESDEINNLAINLNLKKCPVVGIGSIQKTIQYFGSAIPLKRDVSNSLGNELDLTKFGTYSNEQIRANIEKGYHTIISRVTDRDISYLYDYVIKPLSGISDAQVEFYYPSAKMSKYIAEREAGKIQSHKNNLHLKIPQNSSQSSVPEIARLRRIRLYAGTLTAIYHIQKEFPSVQLNIKEKYAPTARCTIGFDEETEEFTNSYFIQMGEWDIGLDSVGRALPLEDDIKPELQKEVKRGTVKKTNDSIVDLLKELITTEEELCNENLFNNQIKPVIKNAFQNIVDSSKPLNMSSEEWLGQIVSDVSNQQKIINEKLTPEIQSKFEFDFHA